MSDSGLNVLIIDDEPANIELLVEIFEILDHWSVFSTTSPEEGIALYRDNPISLLLLDITMPELNGFEVLERLQEMPSQVETVKYVLTGHDNAEVQQKSKALGANGILIKPFAIDQVISLANSIQQGLDDAHASG